MAAPEELEAASRLAAIVESSADAMIGKTLDGVITSWNSGAERIYGYAPEEIIGRNVSVLVPLERSEELVAMLRRVAGGERIEQVETERVRKSGEVFDVSVTISPIHNKVGDIVGASTVARDISDRKRAEAELRDLQERLHQAQRLETVGQLAGGIAHDFNNLLAGIMNYSALAADGLAELTGRLGLGGDATAATLNNDIAEIAHVAERAARLTHQLLIFSHHEVITSEIVDVNAVVIDTENLLRRTIGETIDLQTRLAPDSLRTTGDRGQIEQVLMNLAVNARDAMAGGGTLRIETTDYEADDDYARDHGITRGRYVRLTVSDTGRGMPQDIAVRAFEPFFTTKPTGEGTGLGLATVYGIVTRVGGKVLISSRPGIGTNVDVILPATDAVPTTVAEELLVTPIAARGETILLVEDEEIVREPTRRILANHGYAVLSANSVEEALRIIDAQDAEIDLVLTDVVMPGRSGTELAAHMAGASPRTKILYMSGYASDVSGFRQGAGSELNLIEKPFASEELLRRVREVLDRE